MRLEIDKIIEDIELMKSGVIKADKKRLLKDLHQLAIRLKVAEAIVCFSFSNAVETRQQAMKYYGILP